MGTIRQESTMWSSKKGVILQAEQGLSLASKLALT